MDIFLDKLDNSSIESTENNIQDEVIDPQFHPPPNDVMFEVNPLENTASIAAPSSSVPNIDADAFALDTDSSVNIFQSSHNFLCNKLLFCIFMCIQAHFFP